MHYDISELLHRLANAGASAEANTNLRSDLMDLAKFCQIVPHNNYLLEAVACHLTREVQMIFGTASLIVALTETGRRQVFFAVIARLEAAGKLDGLKAHEEKRLQLVKSLLQSASADLITEHYGSCPAGFLRMLARLGDHARPLQVYLGLHQLADEVPGVAHEVLSETQKTGIPDQLVEVLMALPRKTVAVRLARQFNDASDYQRFMDLYCILTGEQELAGKHRTRLCSGRKPGDLLQDLYLALPFPQPAIAAPGLHHISNGAELVSVAKTFRNCLAGFTAEALRGEHQYYVWSKKDAPPLVIRIRNEAPFGWFLCEVKLARNERAPLALRQELQALLKHCGVRTQGAVRAMMDCYQEYDFTEITDELPDLEAA